MVLSFSQGVLLVLLCSCVGSFAWAMHGYFAQPVGMTKGMRITRACSGAFTLIHIAAIAFSKHMAAGSILAAVVLYLGSLALFWWALSTNRQAPLSAVFSFDVPTRVVDRGPYRYIRHPLYSAYMITWIAGLIATLTWWLIPTVAVMAVLYAKAAKVEEVSFSHSVVKQDYLAYRARTGFWIPKLWKPSR